MADPQVPLTTPAGLPLWIQAISVVGFPIMVASFVLLQDAGYVRSVNKENAHTMTILAEQHRLLVAQQTELIRLSREICKNTGHSSADIERCFQQVASGDGG